MPIPGGTEIPITANGKQISHEIKLLMGNGSWKDRRKCSTRNGATDDVSFQTIWGTLVAICSYLKCTLLYSDQPHKRRLLTSVEAPPSYRLWTDKAWENGEHTEGPPVRRPIDFCLPRVLCLCSLSHLFHFCSLAPVSFTDSRINRGTSETHTFVSGFILLKRFYS